MGKALFLNAGLASRELVTEKACIQWDQAKRCREKVYKRAKVTTNYEEADRDPVWSRQWRLSF